MYAQNEVKIKYLKMRLKIKMIKRKAYISIKIEPKGRNPETITINQGSRNHFLSGMGRGTTLIRHGMSA